MDPIHFQSLWVVSDFPNGIFYIEYADTLFIFSVYRNTLHRSFMLFINHNCTYDCYHFKAARIFINNMSLVLIIIKLMFSTQKHNALNLLTFMFSMRYC